MSETGSDCSHGFDKPSQCWECIEDGYVPPFLKEEEEDEEISRPIKAKYPGHCSECNLDIHEGEMIVNKSGRYIHKACV